MMAAIAITAAVLGCSDSTAPTPDPTESAAKAPSEAQKQWPAGAVLAVGDLPIFQTEVDRVAKWVKFLHPENTQPSLRRQALTHIILERATLAASYSKERLVAQLKAGVALEHIRSGTSEAEASSVTGNWSDLGLAIWGETRALEEGIWSGPFEITGRYVLLRLDLSIPGLVPAADQFTVSVLDFPYTPSDFTREDLALAPQKVQLTILDRDWEALVPSAWGKSLPSRWFEGPKN